MPLEGLVPNRLVDIVQLLEENGYQSRRGDVKTLIIILMRKSTIPNGSLIINIHSYTPHHNTKASRPYLLSSNHISKIAKFNHLK